MSVEAGLLIAWIVMFFAGVFGWNRLERNDEKEQ
jgi:hypothetical protein